MEILTIEKMAQNERDLKLKNLKYKVFVSGTYTGLGDKEIQILEIDNSMILATDKETAEKYYFDKKFLSFQILN
jgi:hypothetical protein